MFRSGPILWDLLADDALDVDGVHHETPSGAAVAIAGKHVNGWWYFLTEEPPSERSLHRVWRECVNSMGVDADDEDDE